MMSLPLEPRGLPSRLIALSAVFFMIAPAIAWAAQCIVMRIRVSSTVRLLGLSCL